MTDSAAIASTLEALGWCVTIPHTIDQVLGIHAERTTGHRPMRHGMTNDEILSTLVNNGGGGGKGGHSDPTARAALWGEPDAIDDDETAGTIRGAVATCHETAIEIGHLCGTTSPPPPDPTLTTRIATTITIVHRWAPIAPTVQLAPDELSHMDWLIRDVLAETATWLKAKAEGIWLEHKGERLLVAEQKPLAPCACCSEWGYRDHAVPSSDLCEVCKRFRDEHKCWPTKSIRDDRAMGRKRVTPGQLAEAKAAKRSNNRKAASHG